MCRKLATNQSSRFERSDGGGGNDYLTKGLKFLFNYSGTWWSLARGLWGSYVSTTWFGKSWLFEWHMFLHLSINQCYLSGLNLVRTLLIFFFHLIISFHLYWTLCKSFQNPMEKAKYNFFSIYDLFMCLNFHFI